MNFWTIDRVAAALTDAIHTKHPATPPEIRGITTDSRAVATGQLFVALAGEKFNGHDFIDSAVEKGAAAIVVSEPPEKDLGISVFRVPDTLVALGQLANFWRRAWGGPIVMVAGSNGKTTTKDIIRAALGRSMKVHATTGNLNNRIGVPLTLLAIPSDC
ncbi:MAG TPA: Mur ligase domain-containing protein, partial [Gemmatimonadaceae bacterium]